MKRSQRVRRGIASNPAELKSDSAVTTRLTYAVAKRQRNARFGGRSSLSSSSTGNVLGFFIVGFLLERPKDGGVARQTLKVDGIPTGTKQFYLWLMHHEYQFVDSTTGGSIERPVWIQFTDLYSFQKSGKWHIEVTGGWADKGDKTHWEGFVGVIRLAVG